MTNETKSPAQAAPVVAASEAEVPGLPKPKARLIVNQHDEYQVSEYDDKGSPVFDEQQMEVYAKDYARAVLAAATPAASELSDEQIEAIAAHAYRNTDKLNGWSGFRQDDNGKYMVPDLTPKDLQLCRVMLAAAPAAPVLAAATPAASVLTDGEIAGAAELHADDISGTGDYGTYTFDRDGLLSFVRAVRYAESCAAPAVQQPAEGGWISVKDERPMRGVPVWYAVLFTYLNASPNYSVGRGYYDGDWRDISNHTIHAPTHWMPADAPQPPPLPAAPTQAEG